VQESVGSAVVAAQTVGGTVGATIQQVANQAFADALSPTAVVAAVVAVSGALIAYVFLPARAATPDTGDPLVDAAAEFTQISDTQRRTLAGLTLGMLADAGMSSLTYNAIAAQSGISTTTLQANWPTRIDAITDALNELYKSYPIPNTGNLATDLDDYLHQLTGVVTNARARQVLGALIAEGASNRRSPLRSVRASSNPGAPPSPHASPTNATTSPSLSPRPSTSSPARYSSGPFFPRHHPTTTSSVPSSGSSSQHPRSRANHEPSSTLSRRRSPRPRPAPPAR
jgi:AcrR family transcriptional regulator